MESTAVQNLREHVFEVRDKRRLKPRVKAGTWAKLGLRNERFWCRVRVVRADGSFVGTLDNDLIRSSFQRGDEIVFQHSHVLEVAEPCDSWTFGSLPAALGSISEAAMGWRGVRAAEGVAAKASERTWFVLPQ